MTASQIVADQRVDQHNSLHPVPSAHGDGASLVHEQYVPPRNVIGRMMKPNIGPMLRGSKLVPRTAHLREARRLKASRF
jgi:hypothetical protein